MILPILLLKIIITILFIVSFIFFGLSILSKYKRFSIIKVLLIILQIILSIFTFFIFAKTNSFYEEFFILISLILNTISLIIFNIRNSKINKKIHKLSFIINIIFIIIGLIISINSCLMLINYTVNDKNNDLNEIMNLGNYNVGEAKELLNNIYTALSFDKKSSECFKIYGLLKDQNKDNEYYLNIYVTCDELYFPPNDIKLILNTKDKTKIERLYWQLNDDTEITLYENNKQVNNYNYIYLNAMHSTEPSTSIKESFEKDIISKLKDPFNAKFEYTNLYFDSYSERFSFLGYVYSLNSEGKNGKEEFILNILPCEDDICHDNDLKYSWYFTNANTEPTGIIK